MPIVSAEKKVRVNLQSSGRYTIEVDGDVTKTGAANPSDDIVKSEGKTLIKGVGNKGGVDSYRINGSIVRKEGPISVEVEALGIVSPTVAYGAAGLLGLLAITRLIR